MHRIADRIEQAGDAEFQSFDAVTGNNGSRKIVGWLFVDNLIIAVSLHLPSVFRMCFTDIYEKEFNFIAIRTVQLLERRSVLAERRSGIAGEEQDNRTLALVRR